MKNALVDLVYTQQIQNEKPNPKTFFRFVSTLEKIVSQNVVVINPNIKMKLINQPEDIQTFKPKDQVIVFGQVIEQNSLFEGQIRKLTIEQALKYEMTMKKLKNKAFLQPNRPFSQLNYTAESENNNSSNVIGNRNGGFYQHF